MALFSPISIAWTGRDEAIPLQASQEIFDPEAATWTKIAGVFDVETSNRLEALKRERTLATVTWLSNGLAFFHLAITLRP
jgi:hypothetical protein